MTSTKEGKEGWLGVREEERRNQKSQCLAAIGRGVILFTIAKLILDLCTYRDG